MKTLLIIVLYISTICIGKKADNTNCLRKTNDPSGYCFQHNPASKRCGALTKSKTLCKRIVKEGNCSEHKQNKNNN